MSRRHVKSIFIEFKKIKVAKKISSIRFQEWIRKTIWKMRTWRYPEVLEIRRKRNLPPIASTLWSIWSCFRNCIEVTSRSIPATPIWKSYLSKSQFIESIKRKFIKYGLNKAHYRELNTVIKCDDFCFIKSQKDKIAKLFTEILEKLLLFYGIWLILWRV